MITRYICGPIILLTVKEEFKSKFHHLLALKFWSIGLIFLRQCIRYILRQYIRAIMSVTSLKVQHNLAWRLRLLAQLKTEENKAWEAWLKAKVTQWKRAGSPPWRASTGVLPGERCQFTQKNNILGVYLLAKWISRSPGADKRKWAFLIIVTLPICRAKLKACYSLSLALGGCVLLVKFTPRFHQNVSRTWPAVWCQ